MKFLRPVIFLAILIMTLSSCQRNPLKVDISGILEEVTIVRFDTIISALGTEPSDDQLLFVREQHPFFTDIYTADLLRIGTLEESFTRDAMRYFLNDTLIQSIYRLTGERLADLRPLQHELVQAFKHFRYYFPERPMPIVYVCVSGFNESVFAVNNLVGISLDKYLGPDIAYYTLLGIPQYKQRRMETAMIPVDAVNVWMRDLFPISETATTLLDHIIYEGVILHAMEAMLPSTQDSLINGFTAEQLEWCYANEGQMWEYLIDNELLYSNRQMDIVRYIGDGPQTNGFPEASPARTGNWIGRQIVRRYLKRNPDATLPDLLTHQNYQEILNQSAYLP